MQQPASRSRVVRIPIPGRGQAEAPLELVVAIIILAASMSLAFLIMFRASEAQCIAKLRSDTRLLDSAILDVAQGSPPTSRILTYELPVCREQVVEAVQFVYFSDPNFCSGCASQFGGCWKIQPTVKDKSGRYRALGDASTCLNIAGSIELSTDTAQGCQELSENPCPPGFDWSSCSSDYGLDVKEKSTFRTLGKLGEVRQYNVTIRKEVSMGAKGIEQTTIRICARPIGGR